MKALQYLQVLLLLLGAGYLAVFHFANNGQSVQFPFPFTETLFGSPSSAMLLGAVAGFLFAALLFTPNIVRRGVALRRQTRRVRELEGEVSKLEPAESIPVIPDRNS